MILYSQRTVIKPIEESDISDIIKMYSEPDAFKYVKPFQDKSVEFFRDFLHQKITANKKEVQFWTVKTLTENVFIGTANLNKLADSDIIQIGCHLSREFWNQGFASELLEKVLNYGTNILKLNEIYGVFENENIASKKLLEKLDFVAFEEKEILQTKVNVFRYKTEQTN